MLKLFALVMLLALGSGMAFTQRMYDSSSRKIGRVDGERYYYSPGRQIGRVVPQGCVSIRLPIVSKEGHAPTRIAAEPDRES